jgi:nitrite reductase/ring-hydroxylating ferredoxin subunit
MAMPTRRDLYRWGTNLLGGLLALGLTVPGAAYLLDPFRRGTRRAREYRPVSRLGELAEGVPRAFSVIETREDAWVTYPPEPIGSVWLVRQPEGAAVPVIAYTAECPHLGCAISLGEGGRGFVCPCHRSRFDLDGLPLNTVPPRAMDRLDVRLSGDADPVVLVRFERFRTATGERIPRA